MVDGETREAPRETALAVDDGVGQRLYDHYPEFLDREPRLLRRKSDDKLSLQACQDVAQEAFLRVARKAAKGELDEKVNVQAYLRAAAWNLARDRLRSEGKLELAGDGLTVSLSSLSSLPSLPEQRQVVGEFDPLEDLVRPAIEAMPPSRRRQIVRLQSQGLSDVQIAASLGMRADRLHRERHKAVRELRDALDAFIRDEHRKTTRCLKKDR
ncbi:sigma-70 family RNA polymerase sigma factor [Streptomyces sp. P9(2023)]|uniref:RNA polymerase sigma factor n=1 Tax=Streptomyces sp. P9(2023) TaxID=3064394 RepID=UPI0028F3EA79|nr:sigma-70 family RNA polymerase sigma factor [Streptomyces sp. P9(2023)]MDT9687194.1 sigma-70 family RNA polymerase sigma factor [Streptomyces sp. P9(2023)]